MRVRVRAEAVTSLLPVALKATSRISSLWPRRVLMHWPVLTFHTLQVRSMEPEIHSSAEKSNCVLEISPRWPERVWRQRPLVRVGVGVGVGVGVRVGVRG